MTKKSLTVDEINALLQEVAIEDAESVVEEDPVPINFTGLELDVEGWDEYVERVLEEGPLSEEVMEE